MKASDSLLDELRKLLRRSRFGVRIGEVGQFLLGQPEVIAAGLVASTFLALGRFPAILALFEQSRENLEDLRPFRHRAVKLLVRFRIVFDLYCARFTASGRKLLPLAQRLL